MMKRKSLILLMSVLWNWIQVSMFSFEDHPSNLLAGTLVTVMVKCSWLLWLDDCEVARLAGVTDTLGVICGFFVDEISGSGNVFCSLAADKPRTISSNFLRFFSFPIGGSSMVCGRILINECFYIFRSLSILTQLFFFINLVKVSSSLDLLPYIDEEDFLGPIEKSWTSLKSIADFIISLSETFGKLEKRLYIRLK